MLWSVLVLVVAAVLVGIVAAGWLAARQRARLEAAIETASAPVNRSQALPDAVLDFALKGGAAQTDLARRVWLEQAAEMELRAGGGWQPLNARQDIATGATGFVWQARQGAGWLPRATVVDAFAGGRGLLDVRIAGLFRVVRARGPAIDRSEAMRYLAELPWAPDAILGNPDLRWRMAEPDWAVVSLDAEGGPVAVRFRFDEAGDIVEMRATGRPAIAPDGVVELKEWHGLFAQYDWVGGRRIPTVAEVGYIENGATVSYFRCRITAYGAVH